jgi:hypothetical protein
VPEAGQNILQEHADALLVVDNEYVKWLRGHVLPPPRAVWGSGSVGRLLCKGVIPQSSILAESRKEWGEASPKRRTVNSVGRTPAWKVVVARPVTSWSL